MLKLYGDTVGLTLENGLRIYVLRRPDSPAAAVHCCVATGSIHETEAPGCGLSHFLEHMLFQGCQGFPGTAAADRINQLGGEFNAYTSFDHTVYYVELPAPQVATAVAVLAAMVRYPEFPEARFAREREVILRERELGLDSPERRLHERLWQLAFLQHPVRFPIIGFREQIAAVDREQMFRYYRRRYTPGRCFWVLVAPQEPEALFELVREKLEDWPRGDLAEPVLPPEPPQRYSRELDCRFADPLARLALGVPLPGAAELPVPALDLLCGVLALSDGSRLVRVLRQERELAVNLGSFCYTRGFGGLFGITACTTPGKFSRLETALRRELERVRGGELTRDELEREKRQQLAELWRDSRNSGVLASTLTGAVLTYGTPHAADAYSRELAAVTLDQLRAVAARILAPDSFNWVRQTPELRKVSRKSSAPGVPETLHRVELPGGTPFYWCSDRRRPLTDLVIVLPGGSIFEPAGAEGLARLTAALLTAGAGRYSESDFAAALDRCGAELTVNAGVNSLMIELNVPTERFARAFELLRTMLLEPAFDPAVAARECANLLAELRSREQQPRAVAELLARQLLYGQHPYGRSFGGTERSLRALDGVRAAAFYRDLWRRPNVQLLIGGSGDPEVYQAALAGLVAELPWQEAARALPPEPEFPAASRSGARRLDREQLAVIYAVPTLSFRDREEPVLEVLNQAENGLASQLFKRVREDHALAYTTGLRDFGGLQRGAALFYGVTAPDRGEQVLALLRAEVERLGARGLESEEFAAAREAAMVSARRRLEATGRLLATAGLESYYGRDPEAVLAGGREFRELTLTRVNATLSRLFTGSVGVEVRAGLLPESGPAR